MRRNLITSILMMAAVFAAAGPVGPPSGAPIYNQKTLQAGAGYNVQTGTVAAVLTAGQFVGGGAGITGVTASSVAAGSITGTVAVGHGGTGATSFTANSILMGAGAGAITALGAATDGQLPIGNTGNGPTLATLTGNAAVSIANGAGSITFSLNSTSATLKGNTFNGASQLVLNDSSGRLPVLDARNLTNVQGSAISGSVSSATSVAGGAAGSIPYQSGASATAFLSAGSSGQLFTSGGAGAPTWITAASANTASAVVQRDGSGNFAAGTITAALSGNATTATSATTAGSATTATTATNLAGGGVGQHPYQTASGATSFLPAMGLAGIIIGNGTSIVPSTGVLAGTANQVIVTQSSAGLTLTTPQSIGTGSSPTFAGLTLSSPLTVANGGTGAATLTTHGVVIGQGTSAVNITPALGNGGLLIGQGTGVDPSTGTLTGNAAVTVTNSAGAITLSLNSSSATLQGNTFNGASQLVQLNGSSQYPAKDGSLITNVTNLNSTGVSGGTYGTARVNTTIVFAADGRATSATPVTIIASSVDVSGITPGTYADSTHVPQCTFGGDGRATSCSNILITGAAPTGSAGQDLSGNYPSPWVVGASTGIGFTVTYNIKASTAQFGSGATISSFTTTGALNMASGANLVLSGPSIVSGGGGAFTFGVSASTADFASASLVTVTSSFTVVGAQKFTGAMTANSTVTFNSQSNFSNLVSTSVIVKGFSPYSGSSANNGTIALGAGDSARGILTYDNNAGFVHINNSWDSASAATKFGMRTAGTEVTPLVVSAAGGGQVQMTNSVSTQAIVSGYDAYSGASTNNGLLAMGTAEGTRFVFDWDGNVGSDMRFINTVNSNSADIIFITKGSVATPIEALRLAGNGNVSIGGPTQFASTVTFNSLASFANSLSTGAKLSGWSNYGGADANNGSLLFGQGNAGNTAYARIDYDGANTNTLRIENGYNGSGIVFNVGNAPTVTAMTISQANSNTTLYGSTMTVGQNGIVTIPSQPFASVTCNSSCNISNNGVAQYVFWDTNDSVNQGMHSTSVSSNTVTVPTGGGGKYQVNASVYIGQPSASAAYTIQVFKNSTVICTNEMAGSAVASEVLKCSRAISLAAADTISVKLTNNGLAAIQVASGTGNSYLDVLKVQ